MSDSLEAEFEAQVLDILTDEVYSMRTEDDSYVEGRQEAARRIVHDIIMPLVKLG